MTTKPKLASLGQHQDGGRGQVAGGMLTAKSSGSSIVLTDEKGGMASVTIADVYQSNGVIHVIDKVLLPK